MIKKFEEYNSPYYQEISGITSQNLNSNDREDISEEYEHIMKLITDTFVKSAKLYYISYGQFGSVVRPTSITLTFGKTPNKTVSSAMFEVQIIKYPDEWYYLTISPNRHWSGYKTTYFKCDQLDGVIKCLEDYFQ